MSNEKRDLEEEEPPCDNSDYDSMFGDSNSSDNDSMFGDSNKSSDEEQENVEEKINKRMGRSNQVERSSQEVEAGGSSNLQQYDSKTSRPNEKEAIATKSPSSSKSMTSMKIPKKGNSANSLSSRKRPRHSLCTTTKNHKSTLFDISSYNDYSSALETQISLDNGAEVTGLSSSQKQLKLLKPDEYPKFDMDTFWRTLREWDFIDDLNQSMKKKTDPKPKLPLSSSSKSSPPTSIQPLPIDFHCYQQYIALWSPLLLDEIKSQIISDVTSMKSSSVPVLSKLMEPVNVIVKDAKSNRNAEENGIITLNIHATDQPGRKGIAAGGYHSPSNRSTVSSSTSSSRGAKMSQHFFTRKEFAPNELVLLITEPTFLDQASTGNLKVNHNQDRSSTQSSYSLLTLLSNASPFTNGKLGTVGIVMHRSKNLKNGLVVQISSRVLKRSAGDSFNICLFRLGHCITGVREFKALCHVEEMSLKKYVLSAKAQDNIMSSLSVFKKAKRDNPLSEHGGRNALGIGFRIFVKSKFNDSQQAAINSAAREYGQGGFTLIKGPPGTGKTTTLATMVNALHLKQYQKYYSEIEKITLSSKSDQRSRNQTATLAAIVAAAKVKPRILICAPSNAAVDNVIKKIIEEQFIDGNGGKYRASIVRVGTGYSSSVSNIALDHIVNQLISDGAKTKNLEETLLALKKELKRLQVEIENLQRRVRLIANASNYLLSRDWEIRIDEDNFKVKERVLFVNHKLKKVQLTCPPPPVGEEEQYPINEQPHYRSCMASLVKYIERHNDNHSKLSQYTLVQNASSNLDTSNYNQVSIELRQELATFLLDSTHIVMTTLGSAGSKTMEYVKKFSVIVIDEAAQCSEPSMLPALNLGSSHCVLVGDPQQLPATIFSMSGRETKYDRSMFQRLEEGGHSVNMLNIQYRMDPLISVFPRQIFYDGSLTDGQNVVASNYGGDLTQKIKISFRYFQPLTVLDLDSHEEREGTNLSNFDEAQLVVHLYSSLDQATDGLVKKSSVAVITPYMQQVAVIKRLFEEKYGLSYKRFIDVSTIDAFQGKEATVVILSCVRASSKGGGIGFLSDVQRMNVALTRAKHFLFVIARCRTILINPFWRDFVAHARKQRAIIRVLPNQNSMKSNGMKSGRRSNASIGKRFPDLRSIRPFYHDDGNFVASTSSHQMKV